MQPVSKIFWNVTQETGSTYALGIAQGVNPGLSGRPDRWRKTYSLKADKARQS